MTLKKINLKILKLWKFIGNDTKKTNLEFSKLQKFWYGNFLKMNPELFEFLKTCGMRLFKKKMNSKLFNFSETWVQEF